ncbi:MAG: CDP-diacylglycerol--glycerol-3-phosphate 3-phosphatidyltransferase [Proteocatella sp.]
MNTPNKLTVLRFILVPFFLVSAYYEKSQSIMIISTLIFAVASFTDFLDGYLARKHNLVTDFGKFMDPLADKVLVAAALLFLVQIQRVDAWLVVIIITREYAISIIRAIAATNGKVIAASGGGKIKTVTQMLAIIMLLLSLPFANLMMYICVVLTLYSGVEYIWNNKELIAEK